MHLRPFGHDDSGRPCTSDIHHLCDAIKSDLAMCEIFEGPSAFLLRFVIEQPPFFVMSGCSEQMLKVREAGCFGLVE